MSIIYINAFQFAAAAAYDPDAQDFINRVIAADVAAGNTSGLEVGVQDAYNDFFVGCKADGTFNALKAACIMAGARTLAGALVPLVSTMPAPTNNNFVAGDYDRETGLVGDGSTKYLNSNRANSADPTDSKHLSVYITSGSSGFGQTYIGVDGGANGASGIFRAGAARLYTSTVAFVANPGVASGLFGASRSTLSTFTIRYNGANEAFSLTSQLPTNTNITVFAMDNLGSVSGYTSDRLAFYSIGEGLDLALLDARVTALVNAIGAAIP